MGHAIGQVLSYGVGVALSPLPIVAVVLMLATPKGRVNGPMFLLGWVVGLAIVGTVVLLISGGANASHHGSPATWNSILKLVLGVLLFGVAVRQWRGRPGDGADAHLPAWMRSIDRFSPRRSAALGIGLSAVNPKNLILTAGAAAAIAQTGASTGSQAGALVVFVLVATLGPGIPVAIYFGMGERAAHVLDRLRAWMTRENAVIMAVICVLIGAKLIGDGITGLT